MVRWCKWRNTQAHGAVSDSVVDVVCAAVGFVGEADFLVPDHDTIVCDLGVAEPPGILVLYCEYCCLCKAYFVVLCPRSMALAGAVPHLHRSCNRMRPPYKPLALLQVLATIFHTKCGSHVIYLLQQQRRWACFAIWPPARYT